MSKQCINCGNILDDNSQFCERCGANQQYVQYQHPAYYQPVVKQTSFGGWIGWVALCSFVPIIGAIIAWLCSNDESVKNFGKAMLIISAVEMVLAVLCIAIFSSIFVGLVLGFLSAY